MLYPLLPLLSVWVNSMTNLIHSLLNSRLWKGTDGQDLVEYALLAGFITVAATAGFPPLSQSISTIFSRVGSLLSQV